MQRLDAQRVEEASSTKAGGCEDDSSDLTSSRATPPVKRNVIPLNRSPVENFSTINWLESDRHDVRYDGMRGGVGSSKHLQRDHRGRSYRDGEGGDVFFMIGGTVSYLFEAAQPWAAAIISGVLCGVIASVVEVVTHWLTDLKLGVCTRNVWSTEFVCCLHDSSAADHQCSAFVYWGEWVREGAGGLVECAAYVVLSVAMATLAAWLCIHYAPFAAGSGIIEIKTILSGVRIAHYLDPTVLAIKCVGLCASVGSGLALGKEGPFVHVGCCVGHMVGRWFPMYKKSESASRELISASAAAGVAVAFGAPIGGVLFALEEVSYFFPHRTMIQAFLTAIVSTLVLKHIDATHTGRLVLFSVSYKHEFHWFELVSFALVGVAGGVLGAMINSLNAAWCHVKRHSDVRHFPVREVLVLSLVSASINYTMPLLRGGMLQLLADLFDDCSGGGSDESFVCREDEGRALFQLTAAALIRVVLMALTFGCKLPAGCFVPSLFIGGCFGRAMGIWTRALVRDHINSSDFLQMSCGSDASKCVVPGVYAIVGAAAVLAGVTRMTICLVVIMFELTGGLEYIVPCMLVTVTAKWIAELLGVPSIYEIHLDLTQYPYLNTKDEYSHNTTLRELVVASRRHGTLRGGPTTERLVVLWNGMVLDEAARIYSEFPYHSFPVVDSEHSSLFIGCVSRSRLRRELEVSRGAFGSDAHTEAVTRVFFTQCAAAADADRGAAAYPCLHQLDWSFVLDSCAILATLDMTVSRTIHIFKTLGNQQVVLVDGGKLVGVLTKKDMVLYLRAARAHGTARGSLMRWINSGGRR